MICVIRSFHKWIHKQFWCSTIILIVGWSKFLLPLEFILLTLSFLRIKFVFLLRWLFNLFVIFSHICHFFPLHLMWSIVSWYFLIRVLSSKICIILFPRFTFWIIHLQLLPYMHKCLLWCLFNPHSFNNWLSCKLKDT